IDKSVWDSVAANVAKAITDSVIDASLGTMPPEYAPSLPEFRGKLRARRDQLPEAAAEYYASLATVVDLHATDAADHARVMRSGEGIVDVIVQSGGDAPYLRRRFDARETREIRLCLHGGDDVATITGDVERSIPVRIIGGNGDNRLIDSSTVARKRDPTRLYDAGRVSTVEYEPPSVTRKKAESDEVNLPFNRIPWVRAYGETIPPSRDHGTRMTPVLGLRTGHGLGLVPRVGIARHTYAFRNIPYRSMTKADFAYSTAIGGFEVGIERDQRFESSAFHLPAAARLSQIVVGEFRGFGNAVANARGSFYDVRATQWIVRPAVGLSFGARSDVTVGPVVRYTRTDSAANFISQNRPYGFGRFGQAGVRLELVHDTRSAVDTIRSRGGISFDGTEDPPLWGTVSFGGSIYPGLWDAKTAYQEIAGVAAAYLTLPFLTRPVVAVRAGGAKLFGNFPYFDAAFLGGSRSLRTEHRQRYAGDASIYGSTELRMPLAQFPFILPLDIGSLGFVDIGRVYADGDSPGGWHKGAGAGFWVGVANPATNVNVTVTNNPERRILVDLGFAF
ncbi:MAG: hypothetical protein ABI681_10590, partial [Gemmatimonadales bacterium]